MSDATTQHCTFVAAVPSALLISDWKAQLTTYTGPFKTAYWMPIDAAKHSALDAAYQAAELRSLEAT
jgi:hypothetical protein